MAGADGERLSALGGGVQHELTQNNPPNIQHISMDNRNNMSISSERDMAMKCESCDMFAVVKEADFTSAYVCTKCAQNVQLKDRVINLLSELKIINERFATFKETTRTLEAYETTILTGQVCASQLGTSALLLEKASAVIGAIPEEHPRPLAPSGIGNGPEEHLPPLPPPSASSCSTPRAPDDGFVMVRRRGKKSGRGKEQRGGAPQSLLSRPEELRLSGRFGVLAPVSPGPAPTPPVLSEPARLLETLVVGDSILRDVSLDTSVVGPTTVCCFPGARILDIDKQLPSLLRNRNVSTIVTHVGSNDTSNRQSEILKQDFITLLSTLRASNSRLIISGPLPCTRRGYGKFSRLCAFNDWLRTLCEKEHLCFIDNFDTFWQNPALFKRDGLHPNFRGSQLLSKNFQNVLYK